MCVLKNLHIEGTRKTPTISLDVDGRIRIEGRSIPEDASLFFNDIIEWVDLYIASNNPRTQIDIALEYLNSGTSKFILQILKKLKEYSNNGHELVINWYFEEGDDDIMERGEYYSSILDMKINYIETE
jgi:SiaC family regulatory phosphoprotein